MTPTQLADAVLRSVRAAVADGELPAGTGAGDALLRRPPHGGADWSTGIALRLAGPAGRPPQAVADTLRRRLAETPGIATVTVAGPGFLDIALADGAGAALLAELLALPAPPVLPEDPARDARAWRAASDERPPAGLDLLSQRTENPLFRVRYAHARACSALRGGAQLGIAPEAAAAEELRHPAERALLALLGERHRAGSAGWLVRLADAHLDAATAAPVLPQGPEKPGAVHRARLALARATATVLADGLSRLGIGAPDHL
ncbi:DALR anticodon-binding domain-containing protein [Streptomyces lonarensis]|uniref:Arginine--tRNA ligase n=1 Tax=Streptomyces lonarensis TaxID=700599 RepID=A0A7X6HXV9_9ACTN|nr:DALR anticodon-binding domain-containing protein [Streptomyces lonarensis]NJQ04991.1 arginine--tRNA ligase [Streptomyces lonarensis]